MGERAGAALPFDVRPRARSARPDVPSAFAAATAAAAGLEGCKYCSNCRHLALQGDLIVVWYCMGFARPPSRICALGTRPPSLRPSLALRLV